MPLVHRASELPDKTADRHGRRQLGVSVPRWADADLCDDGYALTWALGQRKAARLPAHLPPRSGRGNDASLEVCEPPHARTPISRLTPCGCQTRVLSRTIQTRVVRAGFRPRIHAPQPPGLSTHRAGDLAIGLPSHYHPRWTWQVPQPPSEGALSFCMLPRGKVPSRRDEHAPRRQPAWDGNGTPPTRQIRRSPDIGQNDASSTRTRESGIRPRGEDLRIPGIRTLRVQQCRSPHRHPGTRPERARCRDRGATPCHSPSLRNR